MKILGLITKVAERFSPKTKAFLSGLLGVNLQSGASGSVIQSGEYNNKEDFRALFNAGSEASSDLLKLMEKHFSNDHAERQNVSTDIGAFENLVTSIGERFTGPAGTEVATIQELDSVCTQFYSAFATASSHFPSEEFSANTDNGVSASSKEVAVSANQLGLIKKTF